MILGLMILSLIGLASLVLLSFKLLWNSEKELKVLKNKSQIQAESARAFEVYANNLKDELEGFKLNHIAKPILMEIESGKIYLLKAIECNRYAESINNMSKFLEAGTVNEAKLADVYPTIAYLLEGSWSDFSDLNMTYQMLIPYSELKNYVYIGDL